MSNRLGMAAKQAAYEQKKEAEKKGSDPTELARMHGNAPSKGARIDKELMEDDAEILRKKGV